MNKQKLAKQIQEILDEYFPTPPIPLKSTSSYTFLVAVLLSAQCTDARVNIVTPKLFEGAETPEEMMEKPVEEIQELIKTCGLSNSKARHIKGLSKILVEEHKGEVPDTFEALEALPGVGHKTASVVMSQVFKKPAFPVDTHIHRLAKRWGLSCGRNVVQTEKDLKKIFPKKNWNKLHLQLIYFARKFCPARGHDVQKCPICRLFEKEQ